jgi:hypothetical protein
MSGVLLSRVGTVDLVDVDVISEFFGRDFLPYPLMFTRPTGFATQDESAAYVTTVPDRFNHGDLGAFTECFIAYQDADIRVESHVQYIPDDEPSVRMIACRAGELGFFAEQQPDADAVDIYRVSPYDLGAAISEALPLTQPGVHARIVVPEYAPRPRTDFDTDAFAVRHAVDSSTEVLIPACDVRAYATVQSHWRPTRKWGLDFDKGGAVWIQVRDDGDYLYAPDHSYAVPMTRSSLQERIDRLIADDVAILREFRRE